MPISTLQQVMKERNLTHEEAIEAAKQSKQNYEELSCRRLLPVLREEVLQTYNKKEGHLGSVFSGSPRNTACQPFGVPTRSP